MPLADVVRSLRAELQAAIAHGDQSTLRFALDDIELEVDVRVGRERSGGGGIRFWVLNASVDTRRNQSNGSRVRLKLKPVLGGSDDDVMLDTQSTARPD